MDSSITSEHLYKTVENLVQTSKSARQTLNLLIIISLASVLLLYMVDDEALFYDAAAIIPYANVPLQLSMAFFLAPCIYIFIYYLLISKLNKLEEFVLVYQNIKKGNASLKQDIAKNLPKFFYLQYLLNRQLIGKCLSFILFFFIPAILLLFTLITFLPYQSLFISLVHLSTILLVVFCFWKKQNILFSSEIRWEIIFSLSFKIITVLLSVVLYVYLVIYPYSNGGRHYQFDRYSAGAYKAQEQDAKFDTAWPYLYHQLDRFWLPFIGDVQTALNLPYKTLISQQSDNSLVQARSNLQLAENKIFERQQAEYIALREKLKECKENCSHIRKKYEYVQMNIEKLLLSSDTPNRENTAILSLRDRSYKGINLTKSKIYHIDLLGSNLTNAIATEIVLHQAKLSHTNLQHANISWSSLREIELEGANLQDANLQGASLQAAKLQRANLQNTDLLKTNLQNANLQEARLQNTNLREANLQDANLREANLQNAMLRYADLQHANFQDANLQDANLQSSDLQHAELQGAKLQHTNLQSSELKGAELQRANLQHAILQKANLQNAKLQRADLQYANLQEANLQRAELQRADLQYAELFRANLQQAELQGTDLQHAKLQKTNLKNADLSWANLQDSDLQGANLQSAKFQEANLKNADLQKANLQLTRFLKANLQYAKLQKAKLRSSDLREANLQYAVLLGTDFTNSRISRNTKTEYAVYNRKRYNKHSHTASPTIFPDNASPYIEDILDICNSKTFLPEQQAKKIDLSTGPQTDVPQKKINGIMHYNLSGYCQS